MKKGTIVCDTNILIDYQSAGTHVLAALASYVDVIVPDVIFDEAKSIDKEGIESAGINIYPVPIELLFDASEPLPGCSMEDSVCFLLAKEKGYTCATNDGNLRRECMKKGVQVIRGLALLLELAGHGYLTKKQASEAGRGIFDANREITKEILLEFLRLLEEGE